MHEVTTKIWGQDFSTPLTFSVVSRSDNRSKGQISEQMPDLVRLCSDFDVLEVKNRSMYCIPYFREKILIFLHFSKNYSLKMQ